MKLLIYLFNIFIFFSFHFILNTYYLTADTIVEKSLSVDYENITYDSGIEIIKSAIKQKDFQIAETISRKLLEKYPDNSEIITILARLLYWQKNYDESIKFFQKAIEIKPSDELYKELEKVKTSKELYLIDQLEKEGNLEEYESKLKRLIESNRAIYDAGYLLGMFYVKQREYSKSLEIFKMLREKYPDDIGFDALYIESLILIKDLKQAKTELTNLPEEKKQRLIKSREDLFYRVNEHRLDLKIENYKYSEIFNFEKEYSIFMTQKLKKAKFIFGFSNVQRDKKNDNLFSIDIYPGFFVRKNYGNFYIAFSPSPDLVYRSLISAEICSSLKKSDFCFRYQRMDFETKIINIIIPGLIFYLPNHYSIEERVYIVLEKKTYSIMSTLYHDFNHRFDSYLSLSFGETGDIIRELVDLDKVFTGGIRTGFEYKITPKLSFSSEFSFYKKKYHYERVGLKIYLKYWN